MDREVLEAALEAEGNERIECPVCGDEIPAFELATDHSHTQKLLKALLETFPEKETTEPQADSDDTAPQSAADPRDGEPYYIDNDCPDCGTGLVLYDNVSDEEKRASDALANPELVEDGDQVWHDEWVCPECLDGIYLDWPGSGKQTREEHPSGWLYLTQHEDIPIFVDALLDLPTNIEFTKSEFAEHAGVTQGTVENHFDLLVEVELIEEVPETSPRRYRVADSDVVRELLQFNSALNNIATGNVGQE